MAEILRARV